MRIIDLGFLIQLKKPSESELMVRKEINLKFCESRFALKKV